MPTELSFSRDFPLDAGIFSSTQLSLSGSTDASALTALVDDAKFPDGDIQLGHISFTAETGEVALEPIAGATVSFDVSASAQSGAGVYGKAADAVGALNLPDPTRFTVPEAAGQRFLLLDFGYAFSATGSASHPIGVLGSASFGVAAKQNSIFAVLHRFDPNQGAREVLADSLASWRLPRQVAFTRGDVNLRPGTWLIAQAAGSLMLNVATTLGWNMSYARDLSVLGVTHNLSAKIDSGLKAEFGFSVAGKYLLVVGREDAGTTVRLQLWKCSSKGLNFGLDLNVGVQGADPQLPATFDDLIQAVFGVHGLQVLQDLREWTEPSVDIGQKLAGLADKTALDLLMQTTGIDPAVDFAKAKQFLGDILDQWTSLPDKLSSMLWKFLDKQAGNEIPDDFKSFLTDLANPATAADALAKALQKATFGDSSEGQFLEAIADQGLLALSTNLVPVSKAANQVLDVLNGGVIAKLQAFINQKLDLDQIRKAVSDADFGKIEQWLQDRLANFLDKTVGLDELKDVQKAINTLDVKVGDFYKKGIAALTKRYTLDFATTYQENTSDTALLDVSFDLSRAAAGALFAEVAGGSNLSRLLTEEVDGVILNMATLTHEIKRQATVDLHMPFFNFASIHLNDAMVSLTAEDQGGRLLVYQVNAQDKLTVANRAASQLSVFASLKVLPGQLPQIDSDGSIAYEMLQVKADMRPLDLESRTSGFVHDYLDGLFSGGDASLRSFYTDLDTRLTSATGNQSNHLGDIALSMQLSLPASLLGAWLQVRSTSELKADQMTLSRDLQASWKQILPALFFTDLSQYQFNESIAALLVWSSLPISTDIDLSSSSLRFNTDKSVFWDWPDVTLRGMIARDSHTLASLGGKLASINAQLVEAGNSNAGFFAPSKASRLVEMALNFTGDNFLRSLLFTEAQLVGGATDALKQSSAAIGAAKSAPAQAIKMLANFAADLTDTFNNRVSSIYSGMSGRMVGPMLLVEASAALGGPGVRPAALLNLYALNQGHSFNLGTFVDGSVPGKVDTALTQALVSLG